LIKGEADWRRDFRHERRESVDAVGYLVDLGFHIFIPLAAGVMMRRAVIVERTRVVTCRKRPKICYLVPTSSFFRRFSTVLTRSAAL
jgi:hypothetical protein